MNTRKVKKKKKMIKKINMKEKYDKKIMKDKKYGKRRKVYFARLDATTTRIF